MRHRLEYLLFRVLLLLLSGLSWKGTERLGRFLGRFTFEVIRLRRRVTLENLAAAFPEWSKSRHLHVARACYASFGITFLELCRFPRLSPREITERVIFSDPEIFRRVRKEGNGAILLTGHLGNWEMTGAAVSAQGDPVWAVVRRQRNRLIDAHVTRARERSGMRVLPVERDAPVERALRGVLRALRANECVAFLADQDAGKGGLFVPFFGRPASTPVGPVRFARIARCPIVLGFALRRDDGRYDLLLPEPVRLRQDLPPEEGELEATRRTVELLEGVIRRHPEQWFWMHRRWKTRPTKEV